MEAEKRCVFCSVEEFTSSTFDFIVVGGGTAGLVAAARLSENGQFLVGVLEAGENRLNDPLVNIPNLFPQVQYKPEYDWMLKSVPQVRRHMSNVRADQLYRYMQTASSSPYHVESY